MFLDWLCNRVPFLPFSCRFILFNNSVNEKPYASVSLFSCFHVVTSCHHHQKRYYIIAVYSCAVSRYLLPLPSLSRSLERTDHCLSLSPSSLLSCVGSKKRFPQHTHELSFLSFLFFHSFTAELTFWHFIHTQTNTHSVNTHSIQKPFPLDSSFFVWRMVSFTVFTVYIKAFVFRLFLLSMCMCVCVFPSTSNNI